MRKGMGRGHGKGYKNMIGKDPVVHSMSAKGKKQPQRFSMAQKVAMTKNLNLKDTDGDKVADKWDCRPNDPTKQDLKEELSKFKTKAGEFGRKAGEIGKKGFKSALTFAEKELKEFKESRKKKKIEELADISHPTIQKLKKQKERVAELERQVLYEDDTNELEKLNRELDREQEEYRELQNKVTELDVEQFSDAQLKALAIKHKPSSLNLFGSDNPYEDELIRRIRERKKLNKKIKDAEKENVEDGFF